MELLSLLSGVECARAFARYIARSASAKSAAAVNGRSPRATAKPTLTVTQGTLGNRVGLPHAERMRTVEAMRRAS
jgi:hypothetical protein